MMPHREPQLILEPQGAARTRTLTDRYPPPVRAALERGRRLIEEDYRGITADGTLVPGLFPLARTGVPVRPILEAARAFADCLAPSEREQLTFPVDSKNWRNWHNMHPNLFRHGLCLYELDDGRRERALDLLRVTLSVAGYETARGVMRLNEHVAELTGRRGEYDEWYYFMSYFGTPSETAPWGWQFDGHHLALNCFVLGDQLVLAPQFAGSEPVRAAWGRYAGTSVFEREEAAGLALMRALDPAQRIRATAGDAVPRDVLATAHFDNVVLPYAGIPVAELGDGQRGLLLDAVGVYVGRLRPDHAEIRMDEIRRNLAETHFAWIGGIDDERPFYYRIHSPVILIEFDHLPGVVWDNPEPTRRHIHTVVRTPNGNDYGADLLRQHYERHDHGHGTAHRMGLR